MSLIYITLHTRKAMNHLCIHDLNMNENAKLE